MEIINKSKRKNAIKVALLMFTYFFTLYVNAQTEVKLFNARLQTPYGWSTKVMARGDSSICVTKSEGGFAKLCVNAYNGKNKDALKNLIKKDLDRRKLDGQKNLEKGKKTMNNLKVQVNKWEVTKKTNTWIEHEYIFQYKTLVYVISFREKAEKYEASSKKILEAIDKFKIVAN